MKLISMREFVISQWSVDLTPTQRARIKNYADLLSQPLILGMFVPCDLDGNVLLEPKQPDKSDMWNDPALDSQTWANYQFQKDEYRKAKERVLFEGVDLMKKSDHFFIVEDKLGNWIRVKKQATKSTIEDLASHCICTLTQSAIKQIEL